MSKHAIHDIDLFCIKRYNSVIEYQPSAAVESVQFKLCPKLLILKFVAKKYFWIFWLPIISKMLGMSLRVESPTISMWTFPPEIVFLMRSSRSVAELDNPQWYR